MESAARKKRSAADWGSSRLAEFEAAIDRLEQSLVECPEQHWDTSLWVVKRSDPWMWPRDGVGDGIRTDEAIQVFSAFWLVAYHCLFFLDFYLWDGTGRWSTPPEFVNGPMDQGIDDHGAARLPNVRYSPAELLGYVSYCRARAREVLTNLRDSQLRRRCPSWHPHAGKTFRALLYVNLTHIREHGGQLADFLASGAITRP